MIILCFCIFQSVFLVTPFKSKIKSLSDLNDDLESKIEICVNYSGMINNAVRRLDVYRLILEVREKNDFDIQYIQNNLEELVQALENQKKLSKIDLMELSFEDLEIHLEREERNENFLANSKNFNNIIAQRKNIVFYASKFFNTSLNHGVAELNKKEKEIQKIVKRLQYVQYKIKDMMQDELVRKETIEFLHRRPTPWIDYSINQ